MPLFAVALVLSMLLHTDPPGPLRLSLQPSNPTATVVFEPDDLHGGASSERTRWVAPHTETSLWSGSGDRADDLGPAHLWTPLQVVGKPRDRRLPIWEPATRRRAWIDASAVGPVDPMLVGTAYLPPIGRPIAWSGPARITMYTCVELGGCAATASGVWPEPGQVAVDPAVIPLGSTVWVQGLGTFVATDTGSLVRGAHLDVFTLSYQDALAWGVQERAIQVFPPQ
jgi:3D (Asp-Asp-Asp) domain-containing protein